MSIGTLLLIILLVVVILFVASRITAVTRIAGPSLTEIAYCLREGHVQAV